MKRSISALAAAVACAAACAGPAAASTAKATSATQLCSKVSASSVSSLIGYTVPAGVGETNTEKATKQNDGISFSLLGCVYGAVKNLADLKKTVTLSAETLSRSVPPAELKKLVERVQTTAGLKVKIAPFPGLGNESFLMSFSEGGIKAESLAYASGTKVYAATVENNLPASKLESLVKLASKL